MTYNRKGPSRRERRDSYYALLTACTIAPSWP